jgi:predicted CxxxxCH...CXXCH cytochrome family protein
MPSTIPAPLALALAVAAIAAGGCDRARPIADPGGSGVSGGAAGCTACHGDATRAEADALLQAAPPAGVDGGDGGAHLAHLRAGTFRLPIACGECHVVPSSRFHSNGSVDLAFGALSRKDGAAPAFSGGSCASVYCHGATLAAAGGTATAPRWDGAALSCQSCHGHPPPSHAASSTSCNECHPGTVKTNGTLDLAGGLHVNGTVEVNEQHAPGFADPAVHGPAANQDLTGCRSCHGADFGGGTAGVSCNACHGGTAWQSNCTFCHGTRLAAYTAADLTKAAPPRGTQGETATTARGVGAHQAHLAEGGLARPIACAECHASLPASLAHVDGTASVEFGAGARRGGAAPTWSGTGCSATYCHGATLGAGGSNKAPTWTGGGSQTVCGTCHGAPPPAPHVQNSACGSCHTGYTATAVNLALHVDGKVDATASCTSCHGAPPSSGDHGEDDHRVSCGECHPGYSRTTVNAATHQDGSAQVGNRITSFAPATGTAKASCTASCHESPTQRRTW